MIAAAIEVGLAGQRRLECLRVALESCRSGSAGAPSSLRAFWIAVDGLTERDTGARLKDSVTAGNMALVIDRQEIGRFIRPFDKSR